MPALRDRVRSPLRRTIYCGESCWQLAYQTRQRTEQKQEPASETKNDLDFSMQNAGVPALGASIPTLLNHLVNDERAHQETLQSRTVLSNYKAVYKVK